jgi:hypothetical protein
LIDQAYVAELVGQNVIDKSLARAILMVDFTRPIFSQERCALLDRLAAKIPDSTSRKAAPLKRAVLAAIGPDPAPGSAEARLKANLGKTPATLHAEIEAFAEACDARLADAPEAFIEDIQAIVSNRRNRARQLPVFEFSATLPVDGVQVAADAHLDPTTCQLVCAKPPCKKFPPSSRSARATLGWARAARAAPNRRCGGGKDVASSQGRKRGSETIRTPASLTGPDATPLSVLAVSVLREHRRIAGTYGRGPGHRARTCRGDVVNSTRDREGCRHSSGRGVASMRW